MIAIGIGANSQAHKHDFATALAEAREAVGGADVVATFDVAIFAHHVRDAAGEAGLDYRSVALDAMRARSGDCLTRSERTLLLFGVASIAEAAALVGAGAGSQLIMARRIAGNITIAAAQSADERKGAE
ncbi:cobalamin biosynthesis protein [Hyphomicrobium sp.]|jgi:cobalt-precorrin 5A hydrolase|uniref:cobalamin biosynthesis protein n=1 Tax=Hyphomicrobium sp. TaxID=82 RepID=UPI0035695C3A